MRMRIAGGDPVNRYDPSGNIPLRLWDIPMKNKIFRPWEQPKALNLSSKAISRAKHQTATGQAIASLLRPSVSTSAPTVPATPKPIPFERASSNIKVRSTKAEAQAQTTRREKARAYDAHVQKNPNFKIKENSTLRANFETASSHYSSFKQEKDHLIAELGTNEYYKQYRDALSRYQNTRITLKISNLSILEETIKQTRRQ
ncbi:hypothetical protein [Pseudomonas sp. CFII68]|uniref:hypothetical protein n=1 Tax=Pseudomonas sp. CFII68 TaxID=911243 RepID=UPI00210E2B43|nr:hypothetical protein [Pseudomonas sp. CFII68]